MGKGFLHAVRGMGTTALGASMVLLGGLVLPAQGVTIGQGIQNEWSDRPFMVAQGSLSQQSLSQEPLSQQPLFLQTVSNKPLDFKVSLLPSLDTDAPVGPTFSELQLLPDLFLPRYPSFNSQLLDQQLILYSIHLFLLVHQMF